MKFKFIDDSQNIYILNVKQSYLGCLDGVTYNVDKKREATDDEIRCNGEVYCKNKQELIYLAPFQRKWSINVAYYFYHKFLNIIGLFILNLICRLGNF